MAFSLAKWRPRHLLAAWSVYWISLALVTLGPAAAAIWRATRRDGNGSVTASMGDAGLSLTVTAQQGATTLWTGSATLTSLALWIAGPPIALYVAWLMRRRRASADQRPDSLRGAPAARAALREAPLESFGSPRTDKSAAEKEIGAR